ncbi:MAG: 4Fe-4S binding protein [Magnetococcales bacterium]|nr:4Fe-4S binding protein [Magnetococcales bacterium]MBF0437636.1 4Fe-4S binding protein [Magnetococcales bacterium]
MGFVSGWSLARTRFLVQMVMFVVTVYGGVVIGPYAADKISTALPALSCVYDQKNGAYCALRPFQHQTSHQVGATLAKTGSVDWNVLKPLFMTLLAFLAFFVVLNKAFCGWVCPLGATQEFLYAIGRRLRLVSRGLPGGWLNRVRAVKWLVLLLFVFVLPLAAGLGWLPHAAGEAWCRVCPSRLLTTLLTGDGEQMALAMGDAGDIVLGVIGNFLFGFVVIAAFVVRQPFCRICPMLALQAIFKRIAPLRLTKNLHPNCGRCHSCHAACPMEIPEVASREVATVFHDDCTLCGRCMEFCPQQSVLQLRCGPFTLYHSRPETFRARSREELADGSLRQVTLTNRNKTTGS